MGMQNEAAELESQGENLGAEESHIEDHVETKPIDGNGEESNEEPNSDNYSDPAEYKAALKEFYEKDREKFKRERDKKEGGYYAEILKERNRKRALQASLEELKATLAKQQQGSIDEEPQLEKFNGDVRAWSSAMAKHEIKRLEIANASSKAKEDSESSVLNLENEEWNRKFSEAHASNKSLSDKVHRVNQLGIGATIDESALRVMKQSFVGVQLFEYLADNPEEAERIEDLPKVNQAHAMKLLEGRVLSGILSARNHNAASDHKVSVPVASAQVQKPITPKFTPPTEIKGGASTGVKAKHSSEATSMDEFMRLRDLEDKSARKR